ncbi:hypothetical protein LXL04_029919 [Taraxacum kok-saghyz]
MQDMRYLLDPVQFTPKRESDRHLPLLDPVQFTQLRSRSIYTPTQLRSTSPCFRSTLVDSNQIDAVSDRRLFACSTSPCFRSSFPAPCSDRLNCHKASIGVTTTQNRGQAGRVC